MIAMKSIQLISPQSSNSALPTIAPSPLLHTRGMWLLGIFHIQGIYAATFLFVELHMRLFACFCYVCEVAAPCSEWWGKNGHCNVSQKELEGRLQKFTLDHDQGRIFDLVEQLATIPAFQIYEFLETIPTISILPTAGNNTGKSTSSASAGGRLRRRDFVRRANRAARGSVRSST
ncbi:uncharacterized protein LOC110109174 isoform X2 [Dendrobium catenatum]|uniref:uncharacterized protein LOC110109174 isoform X2 n=1 Tax=Dendrobium catenatum TaxID=906689 RepID=UPI0010A00293|nr:uncharacterized protein LOC110109174 isoform X2 [Dendrobium catenatum]